jgi:hypothetical protein
MGSIDPIHTPLMNIQHHIHVCKHEDKLTKLGEIIKRIVANTEGHQGRNVLILADKENIKKVHTYLYEQNLPILMVRDSKVTKENRMVWKAFLEKPDLSILVTFTSFKQLSESNEFLISVSK